MYGLTYKAMFLSLGFILPLIRSKTTLSFSALYGFFFLIAFAPNNEEERKEVASCSSKTQLQILKYSRQSVMHLISQCLCSLVDRLQT